MENFWLRLFPRSVFKAIPPSTNVYNPKVPIPLSRFNRKYEGAQKENRERLSVATATATAWVRLDAKAVSFSYFASGTETAPMGNEQGFVGGVDIPAPEPVPIPPPCSASARSCRREARRQSEAENSDVGPSPVGDYADPEPAEAAAAE